MVLGLCLLLLLSGCINEVTQPENLPPEAPSNTSVNKLSIESIEIHPITFSHLEQQFEIIPFYKEIEYVAQAREDETKNGWNLFHFHPDYDYVSDLMKRVDGYVYDEGIIILSLDPNHYSKNILRAVMASSYYYTFYSESTYKKIPTLLDSIVITGKSNAFAKIIYPDIDVPWVAPLSRKVEALVWSAMAELLSKQRSTANLYFNFTNGDSSVGIPPWSDYRIVIRLCRTSSRVILTFLLKNGQKWMP